MKNFAGFAIALLVGAACGGKSTVSQAPSDDAGTPEQDGGSVLGPDGAAPLGSYTVTFGPIDVASGTEKTQCVVKRLGNPAAMHVGAIHNALGTSSHHMIVYRVNDTVEQTTPFDCAPFKDTLNPAKGSPLMITQKKDELLTLPQGVAYSLDANQMIRLEMHYINAGQSSVSLQSSSTMIPIADADFQYEADFLFIGNPDITLPPMTKTTLGPTFFALPSTYAGTKFFAVTGHEHQLGTNVTVSTATNAADPGTPVYDVPGWTWSEPKTVMQDPPFTVPAGGGFSFTCDWNNTTSAQVSFGESANNEMCFFWAYYYPSKGAKVCFHTNKVQGGADFCCPGSSFCQFVP